MNQNKQILFWLVTATVINTGCDGNDVPIFGEQQEEIYSGQFLDSAVANLDYKSSTRSGTTDTKGLFSYQNGESVTFSVGKVILGETAAQKIVTPVNLVSDSDTSTPEVQNITRFLLALDQDNDSRNGITISTAVKTAANSWSQIDFATADFDSQVANIITETGNADNRTATLPDANEAREHLEKSILCAYSGGYTGTFSGSSSQGEWMLVIDDDGNIYGVGSDSNNIKFKLKRGKLDTNSSSSFWADFQPENMTQTTAKWEGNVSSEGDITGSWNNTDSGETINLKGSRKILTLPANTKGKIYRGTIQSGEKTANNTFDIIDTGIIILAIDDNTITGKGYLYYENIEF